jgi:hypothetical protein
MARLLITKAKLTGACTDNPDWGIKVDWLGECPAWCCCRPTEGSSQVLVIDYTVNNRRGRVFDVSARP